MQFIYLTFAPLASYIFLELIGRAIIREQDLTFMNIYGKIKGKLVIRRSLWYTIMYLSV